MAEWPACNCCLQFTALKTPQEKIFLVQKYLTEQQIIDRAEGAKGLGLVATPRSQHQENIQQLLTSTWSQRLRASFIAAPCPAQQAEVTVMWIHTEPSTYCAALSLKGIAVQGDQNLAQKLRDNCNTLKCFRSTKQKYLILRTLWMFPNCSAENGCIGCWSDLT